VGNKWNKESLRNKIFEANKDEPWIDFYNEKFEN